MHVSICTLLYFTKILVKLMDKYHLNYHANIFNIKYLVDI